MPSLSLDSCRPPALCIVQVHSVKSELNDNILKHIVSILKTPYFFIIHDRRTILYIRVHVYRGTGRHIYLSYIIMTILNNKCIIHVYFICACMCVCVYVHSLKFSLTNIKSGYKFLLCFCPLKIK